MSNKFKGVWCPSVTPFTKENKIDDTALGKHYKRLESAGIDGILVMGSIGEFATLKLQEREQLIAKARSLTNLPLIAHVSDTCVSNIVHLSSQAKALGYDAVMILPHYYYAQNEQQLLEYYLDLDRQIGMPWFIYNFPARTGCDVNASLVIQLIEKCSNFVGIKDTVDTLSHTREIVLNAKSINPEFSVLAGYDEYFAPNLLNGGHGVLSGLTNLIPEVFVELVSAYKNRDMDLFIESHQKISRLMSIYSIGNDFITTIKTAVSHKYGYMNADSRNYAGKCNHQDLQKIDEMLI